MATGAGALLRPAASKVDRCPWWAQRPRTARNTTAQRACGIPGNPDDPRPDPPNRSRKRPRGRPPGRAATPRGGGASQTSRGTPRPCLGPCATNARPVTPASSPRGCRGAEHTVPSNHPCQHPPCAAAEFCQTSRILSNLGSTWHMLAMSRSSFGHYSCPLLTNFGRISPKVNHIGPTLTKFG